MIARLQTLFAIAALVAAFAVAAPRAQTPAPPPAPSPQAPSDGTGTLSVHVDPPTLLYVDGKPIANAPTADYTTAVPAGLRIVRLVHPDYQDLLRRIRIEPGKTTTLSIALAEKGVRKTATPARGRGAPAAAGRGAAARGQSAGRGTAPTVSMDPDVAAGIDYVQKGDFEPAVDVLYGATRNLAGAPRLMPQQALAFLYLGTALVELDNVDKAKEAFAFAQRADRTLVPRPSEFSKQIVALWQEAKSMKIPDDFELAPLHPVEPPAGAAADGGNGTGAGKANASDTDPEFIEATDSAVALEIATPTNGHPCSGTLAMDHDQRVLSWTPKASGCSTAFSVPFDDVRSPAAAPRGGLLLQFRTDRAPFVLMPAPDADLLEPDVDKMTLADLPPSTRVHMRRTEREIMRALGRPYDPRLTDFLVYVPLDELVENAADFDGGVVRTSGKLTTPSPGKGPYSLTDENASVQIVPAGPAIQLLRSQSREWINKELIVSGTFRRPAISANVSKGTPTASYTIGVTKVEPAEGLKYKGPARSLTLEQLVKNPPAPKDLVRVIGKYRGLDSYGDLPLETRRNGTDWVIKDQIFAVWVTGKAPSGPGFSLTNASQTDRESTWVAVTGTVEERRNFIYMRAEKVELSPPPSEAAAVAGVRLQTGARTVRPDIVYTDPVEGTEEIGRDQQILIQFTKAMDEATFAGNVLLRYADGPAGTFRFLDVAYYPDRNRSLVVDPGMVLAPGRTVECVLLAGIKDIDNQPLAGSDAPGGRVLKWKVRAAP